VPLWALTTKRIEVAVAPDDTRGQQHRAAGPCRALAQHDVASQLAQAGGGDEPRHPGACDRDHVKLNVGLCSTYSIRTRSGPHRKAAYVFAASTTDSTSIESSPASAITSSAASTSTARWFKSGRSPT